LDFFGFSVSDKWIWIGWQKNYKTRVEKVFFFIFMSACAKINFWDPKKRAGAAETRNDSSHWWTEFRLCSGTLPEIPIAWIKDSFYLEKFQISKIFQLVCPNLPV
jgi:hypothetical protein